MGPAGGGGGRRGPDGAGDGGGDRTHRPGEQRSGPGDGAALSGGRGGGAGCPGRPDPGGDGTDLLLGAPTGGRSRGRNGIHPGCRSAVRGGPGVFTNEAGLGTSAMAHAAAEVDCPARQGMWGIVEVCVSTLLVCTATALVILVSGGVRPGGRPGPGGVGGQCLLTGWGAPLTAAAFSSVLGPWGGAVVSLSLLLFAFSSILGWSWYGEQSILYLTGSRRLVPAYRLVFLSCVVLGSVWEGEAVWGAGGPVQRADGHPQSDGPPAPLPPGAAGARDWERTGG